MFSVYSFPLWWLREYIYFVLLSSSNRKYCLGLGHETMVCTACLSVFLWSHFLSTCTVIIANNQPILPLVHLPTIVPWPFPTFGCCDNYLMCVMFAMLVSNIKAFLCHWQVLQCLGLNVFWGRGAKPVLSKCWLPLQCVQGWFLVCAQPMRDVIT